MTSVHQGEKKKRSMRWVNAEAEEDTNGEDDRCKEEMEEECVQEERPFAPAINKDKKLRAEKVMVENFKRWKIDQFHKKCLQRRAWWVRNRWRWGGKGKVLIRVGGADQRERENTIPCPFMEEWQKEKEEVEEKKEQGKKAETGTKREKETENHFGSHASFMWDIFVPCPLFCLHQASSLHFLDNPMLIVCLQWSRTLRIFLFAFFSFMNVNISTWCFLLRCTSSSFPAELASLTEETLETDRATLWVGG